MKWKWPSVPLRNGVNRLIVFHHRHLRSFECFLYPGKFTNSAWNAHVNRVNLLYCVMIEAWQRCFLRNERFSAVLHPGQRPSGRTWIRSGGKNIPFICPPASTRSPSMWWTRTPLGNKMCFENTNHPEGHLSSCKHKAHFQLDSRRSSNPNLMMSYVIVHFVLWNMERVTEVWSEMRVGGFWQRCQFKGCFWYLLTEGASVTCEIGWLN